MTLYKGNKVIAGSRSYIGNIGDIKYTTRVDLPFGGSWCDGSIKLRAQFPTVYQMLIDGKLQALDIATYESALNLNGSCGFFGLDTATESFRVPSLNDVYIKSGQVADEFGAESLPNIKGSVKSNIGEGNSSPSDSALYTENQRGHSAWQGSVTVSRMNDLNLDASRVSPAYQDGAKVNPDHVKYRAYVVLYTGADTNVDITKEIQLNNPFSFGMSQWFESDPKNASWLLSDGVFHSGAIYESFYNWLLSILNGEAVEGVSVKANTDTYGDYDYVVNTTDGTFRLPLNVLKASGNAVVGNGNPIYLTANQTGRSDHPITNSTSVGVNISTNISNANGDTLGITTDPTKSGIETSPNGLKLYFYVGETVQDANLINASKVLDLLAKLESYDYVVEYKTPTAEDRTWYRVYKSGWVEQGGRTAKNISSAVVTFPKKMANTNYSVSATIHNDTNGGSGGFEKAVGTTTFTTTSMGIDMSASANYSVSWEVKGRRA